MESLNGDYDELTERDRTSDSIVSKMDSTSGGVFKAKLCLRSDRYDERSG